MTALQRALPLTQVDDAPVLVSQDLYLDVARPIDEPLDEDRLVAECAGRLAASDLQRIAKRVAVVDDVHALAATAHSGLDDHGKPDLAGARDDLLVVGSDDPGHGRHSARLNRGTGSDLVTHDLDRLGARTDELDAGFGASTRERGVLRQEPVAGMNRLRAGLAGRFDHLRDAQIAFAGIRRPQPHRLITGADVRSLGIGIRVDGDGGDTHLAQRAGDADGDLAAVGDQDLVEYRCRLHCHHILNTP